MATTSELKEREIRSRESIADKDRAQKERSDKRAARASFYGSSIKSLGSVIGKMNDPSWYQKLKASTEVNASIPDFQTLGVEDPAIMEDTDVSLNVPVVIAAKYIPTIGAQIDKFVSSGSVSSTTPAFSAANRALNRVATALENRNSRVASYSRDTIGRYLFMVTDIASDICRLKTVIDVYTMAESTKPFLGRQIIRALGFQYPAVKADIANIKSEYNLLVHDFNQGLPIPSDLSFLKRQLWLSNTLIKDMDSEYSSYLCFSKAIEYSLITTSSATKNADEYVASKPIGIGFHPTSFIHRIRSNMEGIINGATWKPLIRDLRGGTKADGWLRLPEDALTKTINIVDFDEVRSQVHNMVTLPAFICALSKNSEAGVTFKGMVYNSASIGGDSAEAVVQNAYVGGCVSHGSENASSEFLKHMTPGTMLFVCSTAATQTNCINALARVFPYNGQTSVTKPYILDQYRSKKDGDGFLVSSRLKSAWTVKKADLTIASGDSPFYFNVEIGNYYNITTVGTFYHILISPSQYGTEIVTDLEVVEDVDDSQSVGIYDYATAVACLSDQNFFYHNHVVRLSTQVAVDINGYAGDLALYIPHLLGFLTTYDWHPLVDIGLDDDGDYYHRIYGELDHYTTYSVAEQQRLNEQCVESEFTLADEVFLKPLAGN